jgi:hypothetical protein
MYGLANDWGEYAFTMILSFGDLIRMDNVFMSHIPIVKPSASVIFIRVSTQGFVAGCSVKGQKKNSAMT